jgi:heme exporter protein B
MPVAPSVVFWAKLVVNFVALTALECLLMPLFFVLSDVPFWPNAGKLLLVAALANAGMASVGTLVSALAAGIGKGNSLLVLIVLPLIIPVVLAAAECTRLIAEGRMGETWWRWLQLLGAFGVVFMTAGTLLFEYVIEE